MIIQPIQQSPYTEGQEMKFDIFGEIVIGTFKQYVAQLDSIVVIVSRDDTEECEVGQERWVHSSFLVTK